MNNNRPLSYVGAKNLIMNKEKLCFVCGTKAPHQCTGCYAVNYCSKEHQLENWKKHKLNCRPFRVERDPQTGYHLVASRDIQPSDYHKNQF